MTQQVLERNFLLLFNELNEDSNAYAFAHSILHSTQRIQKREKELTTLLIMALGCLDYSSETQILIHEKAKRLFKQDV